MPITELLEENARKYGNDVALVEVNPQVLEGLRPDPAYLVFLVSSGNHMACL